MLRSKGYLTNLAGSYQKHVDSFLTCEQKKEKRKEEADSEENHEEKGYNFKMRYKRYNCRKPSSLASGGKVDSIEKCADVAFGNGSCTKNIFSYSPGGKMCQCCDKYGTKRR